jgi:hypothetical protein
LFIGTVTRALAFQRRRGFPKARGNFTQRFLLCSGKPRQGTSLHFEARPQDSKEHEGNTMNKIAKTSGIKVKSNIKAGGIGSANHNRVVKTTGLKVRSNIKAGGLGSGNHNRTVAA